MMTLLRPPRSLPNSPQRALELRALKANHAVYGLNFGPTEQQQNDERLRFLREQTRRGRISTILTGPESSAGGGFQLGKKSLLGA